MYRKIEWYQDGILHVSIHSVHKTSFDSTNEHKLVLTVQMPIKPVMTVQMYTKPLLTVQMYTKSVLTVQMYIIQF